MIMMSLSNSDDLTALVGIKHTKRGHVVEVIVKADDQRQLRQPRNTSANSTLP